MIKRLLFPKIDLSEVKGVLIDLDNTLYAYEPAHLIAIEKCYNAFLGDGLENLSLEEFSGRYRDKRTAVTNRLIPQGVCRSRLFAFQALFEEMKTPQAYNKALKYEMIYWNSLIDAMIVNESALAFLKQCREQSIKVCVVSDMQAHFQIRKLQKLSVDYLIDYLVTSEEVGKEKPAPDIFVAALRKLGLTEADVIMIGDSVSKDIKGAEGLGIKVYKVDVGS